MKTVFLLLTGLMCFVCSQSPLTKLPPDAQVTVRKLNREIKQLDNDLKFMVLEKEKATGAKKNRYIKKQMRIKSRLKRLSERRKSIYAQYKK